LIKFVFIHVEVDLKRLVNALCDTSTPLTTIPNRDQFDQRGKIQSHIDYFKKIGDNKINA